MWAALPISRPKPGCRCFLKRILTRTGQVSRRASVRIAPHTACFGRSRSVVNQGKLKIGKRRNPEALALSAQNRWILLLLLTIHFTNSISHWSFLGIPLLPEGSGFRAVEAIRQLRLTLSLVHLKPRDPIYVVESPANGKRRLIFLARAPRVWEIARPHCP